MPILKRGRAGAGRSQPDSPRRKRKPAKRVATAPRGDDEAARQQRDATADGLRGAIAEVGSQLDAAERLLADLTSGPTRGPEGGNSAAEVLEFAAADLQRAVERVEDALIAVGGSTAREAAGTLHGFHRGFASAISAIVDRQLASAEDGDSSAPPEPGPRWFRGLTASR